MKLEVRIPVDLISLLILLGTHPALLLAMAVLAVLLVAWVLTDQEHTRRCAELLRAWLER